MDVYEQDAELRLLSSLLSRLEHRTMIDVGAELGAVTEHILEAGAEAVHALDPHPDNAGALRARFGDDPRLTVHECAVSDDDGRGELNVSSDAQGTTLPFGHTLLARKDTDEITWRTTLPVTRRSLQSLVAGGEIPASVGILKIDTEGHDLAVVQGMGTLHAEVVMVEHWSDLPNGLGACPWTAEEMLATLGTRGFDHFAFIIHRGEFVTLKWDDATVERGAMGNLIFLHDSVLDRLLPTVLECAGWCAEQAVSVGQMYMDAAGERLSTVEELKQTTTDRMALIEMLKQAAGDRLTLIHELEQVAQERLAALERTAGELASRNAELEATRQQIPG
jgi:FkbM family methyltransferase